MTASVGSYFFHVNPLFYIMHLPLAEMFGQWNRKQ